MWKNAGKSRLTSIPGFYFPGRSDVSTAISHMHSSHYVALMNALFFGAQLNILSRLLISFSLIDGIWMPSKKEANLSVTFHLFSIRDLDFAGLKPIQTQVMSLSKPWKIHRHWEYFYHQVVYEGSDGGWRVPELLCRTLHSDSANLTSMIMVKLKRNHWVCASCNDLLIQPVPIRCNILWGDSQLEIIVVVSLEVLIFTWTGWIQK